MTKAATLILLATIALLNACGLHEVIDPRPPADIIVDGFENNELVAVDSVVTRIDVATGLRIQWSAGPCDPESSCLLKAPRSELQDDYLVRFSHIWIADDLSAQDFGPTLTVSVLRWLTRHTYDRDCLGASELEVICALLECSMMVPEACE